MLTLNINNQEVRVPQGSMVSAAIWIAGETSFRHSVTGEPRAPFCGIGICMECRVTIDGQEHRLSCQIQAEEGMSIQTA